MNTNLKNKLIKIYLLLNQFGINPLLFISSFKNIFFYISDYIKIIKSNNSGFKVYPNYPCLHDKFDKSGTAKGHYFHQDIYVAKKIFLNIPEKHVDIGSRVDGFVAHVASFRNIEVFDIRKLESKTDGIIFKQANLMELNSEYINYTDSISSLHAIEHFGLGRYGDPIDINGHLKGLENIHKILKKGGKFYFSVPIGPQRIEFNAHRVFSIGYLLNIFKGKYNLDSFSFIDDNGDLNENVILNNENIMNNCNTNYGCGIFELTKI